MKKFILTVILVFTLLIQNITSAADYNSIDWNSAPRFGDKQSFINYIKDCEKNCKTFIPVVFTNGLFVDVDEFSKIAKQYQYTSMQWWDTGNGRREKILYEVGIYPGAKVEYAYRTGNTSILSNDEKKLYNLAIKIVNEASRQPTELQKELYLHEVITERVSYYTTNTNENAPRHCTALGALLDGRANCQGYSDAFYMLGRMAGFKVDRMSGKANRNPHVWNTIDFGDGRIYAVDVTFDDPSFTDGSNYNSYIYFNAPLEILQATHTWEAAYNPKIYPKIDGRYFYFTQEFNDTNGEIFGFHSNTADDALGYIAQRIAKENKNLSWGMAPYSQNYANTGFSLNRLVREILPKNYNWYGSAKMSVSRRGNWIFFTVDAKKSNN